VAYFDKQGVVLNTYILSTTQKGVVYDASNACADYFDHCWDSRFDLSQNPQLRGGDLPHPLWHSRAPASFGLKNPMDSAQVIEP